MDGIVGAVKVQNHLPGRFLMRFNENFHQFLTDLPAGMVGGLILKSAQGRVAGQVRVAADSRLKRRVLSHAYVIVEVFVSLCKGVYSLPKHVLDAV